MNRELDPDRQTGSRLAPGRQPEREIAPEARRPDAEPFASRSYEPRRSRPGRPRPHQARNRNEEAAGRVRTDRSRASGSSTDAVSERDAILLADIGRFRVIRASDLRRTHFQGNERSLRETLARLRDAGLIEDHLLSRRQGQNSPSAASTRIVALTRTGKRVAETRALNNPEQQLYAGLVKPREALHDSNLYRLFQAHTAKLAREGRSVRRVVLDFELKREYLRELRRRERQAPGAPDDQLKREAADRFNLAVVDGKVQFPDLRLEYENSLGERSKVDLELATADYRQAGLAAKARAGFTLYAALGDEGRLGAIPLDDHDLVAGILSF